MNGYVLSRDDPYVAVSAADGAFQIANVPAGVELEFQLWHEKSGDLKNIALADGWITAARSRRRRPRRGLSGSASCPEGGRSLRNPVAADR